MSCRRLSNKEHKLSALFDSLGFAYRSKDYTDLDFRITVPDGWVADKKFGYKKKKLHMLSRITFYHYRPDGRVDFLEVYEEHKFGRPQTAKFSYEWYVGEGSVRSVAISEKTKISFNTKRYGATD